MFLPRSLAVNVAGKGVLLTEGRHETGEARMRNGAEVSKYVTGRGGVERFSLCQRGEALLVFVEEESEILDVKETPVF